MIRVKLDRTVSWKGQVYAGECEIPEDLAQALGVQIPTAQVEEEPKESESSGEHSGIPDSPKSKRRRQS